MNNYEIRNNAICTSHNIIAETRSKAKYLYFKEFFEEYEYDFKDFLKYFDLYCKIQKIGKARLSDRFTKDIDGFNRMKNYRDIEFAELGMKIDVNGKIGHIVGYNKSSNLDVYFPEENYIGNCHPHWETTYYGSTDKVIRCYKKSIKV